MRANALNAAAHCSNDDGAQRPAPAPASAATTAGVGSDGAAAAAAVPCLTGLPIIRVPLADADEVPSALAAIQFAYTGQVEAGGSVREVLELYRQGQYLQVDGCSAACVAALEEMLAAAPSAGVGSGADSGSGVGGDSGGFTTQPCPTALELYGYLRLWPDDPALEPAFASVLSAARARLVAHFGNALTALNTLELREQLLALPAEGLEALLESDDFGTDVEDTVLLLLATWVQENGDTAGAEAVERLCRRVRLAQLSPEFAALVLPLLASARIARPKRSIGSGGPGWFPITGTEAAFMLSGFLAGGSTPKRRRLQDAAVKVHGLQAGLFDTKRRRQCLAASGGDGAAPPGSPGQQQRQQPQCPAFGWSISQAELERGLRGLQPGSTVSFACTLDSGLGAVSVRGFEWWASVDYKYGDEAAGLFLWCHLPAAYHLGASSLGGPLAALAQIGARWEVDRWRDGVRAVASAVEYNGSDFFGIGACSGLGVSDMLPLQRGGGCGGGTAAGGGGASLAAWSEYLHGGRITGRAVLRPLDV
ncbi:hypothetical protein GPECTOR_33g576 [Gonium pectorale]|uniref:BACK domain-containing protein n=1 Tax=Gonium pectorale TaxID=33097 RepID=A0A150GCX5_GONPE|nr:hypothetical protein GPECTOR_33g576 [Gonium pectorale]|eukprot:KXZ47694.1 hypothetical protein GPECTOR_33g576 [Gonium pectorale]